MSVQENLSHGSRRQSRYNILALYSQEEHNSAIIQIKYVATYYVEYVQPISM